jgi:hypothetical protein
MRTARYGPPARRHGTGPACLPEFAKSLASESVSSITEKFWADVSRSVQDGKNPHALFAAAEHDPIAFHIDFPDLTQLVLTPYLARKRKTPEILCGSSNPSDESVCSTA